MSTHSPELILDDDRDEVARPSEEEPTRSTSDHVLVIDDDPDVLGLFKACLESQGYRVTAASDGPAGIDLAIADPPTIVILDMIMPGMGGLEVLERLRGDPRTQPLPILMVSGQDDVEARVKCLRKGVDDFIAKPFEREELVARVEALIRRASERGRRPAPVLTPDDRRRLQILRNALRDGPESLVPDYDIRTASGYAYPAAGASPDEDGPRDPIEDLEHLHSRGYLERAFHDVVLTCPYCEHHNIHLREVCPACGSADLRPVEMIHHYRCAFVGPLDSFRRGNKLVCPKCRVQLRHIGLEYEKPTDTVQCGSCDRGFQEPDVAARCRGCRRPFPPEQAERRRVFAYALTAAGRFAAEVGSFIESPGGPDFTEEETEVYRPEFFRELVSHEVGRGISLGHPTALLRIGVRGLDKLVEARGPVAGRRVLQAIVRHVRGVVRRVDKIGRMRPADFVVLIPGADTRTVVAVGRRLAESFAQIQDENLEKVNLSYAWAIHPHEAEDAHALLARVMEETPSAHFGDPDAYEPRFDGGTMLPPYGTSDEEMDDGFQYVDADAVGDVVDGEEAPGGVAEDGESHRPGEGSELLIEPSAHAHRIAPVGDPGTDPDVETPDGEFGAAEAEYDEQGDPVTLDGGGGTGLMVGGAFFPDVDGELEIDGPYELSHPGVVPDAEMLDPLYTDGLDPGDPEVWWRTPVEDVASGEDGSHDVGAPAIEPPAEAGDDAWWSTPADQAWTDDGSRQVGVPPQHAEDDVESWWSNPPSTGAAEDEYWDDPTAGPSVASDGSESDLQHPASPAAPSVEDDEFWWTTPPGEPTGESEPAVDPEQVDEHLDTELVLPEDEDFHSGRTILQPPRYPGSVPGSPVLPPIDDEDAWWSTPREDEDDDASSDSEGPGPRGRG